MGDLAPDGTPYSPQERASFELALSFLTADLLTNPPPRINMTALVSWHRCIATDVPRMLPGGLRTSQRVRMGSRPTVAPHEVVAELEGLMRWLNTEQDKLERYLNSIKEVDQDALAFLVNLSCLLHAKLVAIHPFMDGNGRISRLAQAWLLARYGFKPPIFKDRGEYLTAINAYHDSKNIAPLRDLTLCDILESDDALP